MADIELIKQLIIQLNNVIGQTIGEHLNKMQKVTMPIVNRLEELALKNYDNSRMILQSLLGILSRSESEFIIILYVDVINKYHNLYNTWKIDDDSDADWQNYIRYDWEKAPMKEILEKVFKSFPTNKPQINVYYPSMPQSLNQDERRALTSFILDDIQRHGVQTVWPKATIDNMVTYLSFLRSLCIFDKIPTLFYYCISNVIDRFVSSGNAQQSRDIAETALLSSYQDSKLEMGYLVMSRCYIANHNLLAALLFFDIMLDILSKENKVSRRLQYEIVWTLLKIFREFRRSTDDDFDILRKSFDRLNMGDYEVLSFYCTYFSCIVYTNPTKPILASMIEDFLNSHREALYKNAAHSAMPWITLIGNLDEYQPKEPMTGLDRYKEILINIVRGEEKSNPLLDVMQDKELSPHLKSILTKLDSTRNRKDYEKDNQVALYCASRLLVKAARDNNPSDFILAMRPKCDFTFVKKEIPVSQVMKPFEVTEPLVDTDDAHYTKLENLNYLSCVDPNDALLWIGHGIHDVYMLTVIRQMYKFDKLTQWEDYKLDGSLDKLLEFKSTVKEDSQPIYYKSKQDYKEETEKIWDATKGNIVPIPDIASRALLCIDTKISGFPVNLIHDERTGRFLGDMIPTANVISTELLITTNLNDNLPSNFSKSFWMPEETGDTTFFFIRDHINSILSKYGFLVSTKIVPDVPISSEVNVICVHGNLQSGTNEILYSDKQRFTDLDKIIGKGKILIMFTCYSGAIARYSYDNAMHTLAKKYLSNGYDSVVAPMWALSTEIIPIWLDAFMTNLNHGCVIIDCVYAANMSVKSCFTVPSAWANMHLFGNPFTRVKS